MTQTGTFVGTVDYIAPEQIEGRRVDARADVYALGCVTYQLLSGGVPFPRDSDIAKILAHVNDPPPPLRDAPPPLAAAVSRAMAKRPADRFLSAGDFGRAVLAGAEGRSAVEDGRTVAAGDAAILDRTHRRSPPGCCRRGCGQPRRPSRRTHGHRGARGCCPSAGRRWWR